MARIVSEAIKLDERLAYPQGYNKVIVKGFGDEYKRQKFPIITVDSPDYMISDGGPHIDPATGRKEGTWYTITADIYDTNAASNVLVHNITETVSASDYYSLSAGSFIHKLNAVYVDDNGSPGALIYHPTTKTEYFDRIEGGSTIIFSTRLDEMSENPNDWVEFYLDYDGNRLVSFGTGYPNNLPTHLIPTDEEDLVGGIFYPENGNVLVDGYTIAGNPPIGVAHCQILFRPTPSAHGPCVISAKYEGFETYDTGYVERGGFVGVNISLEANPSTICPKGTVDDDPERTDTSFLTFWGTNSDGTPLEEGTEIVFEALSGTGGTFQGNGISLIETAEGLEEEIFTTIDTEFSVAHPIVSLDEVTLDGVTNGDYEWEFDAASATIDGTKVTLSIANALPLNALPLRVIYDASGVASSTYTIPSRAQAGEEHLISAKINGTKRNATATITACDLKAESNYTLTLSADPTQLTEYVSSVPEDPPTIVYTSDIEVSLWDANGLVPNYSVNLDLIYGGKSGKLAKTSLSCRDTKAIVEESQSVTSSTEEGEDPVWDTITVNYPIKGYASTQGRAIGGGGGAGIEITSPVSSAWGVDSVIGNVIKLANPVAGGFPVYVSYNATGVGFTTYKADTENVEELVGLMATTPAHSSLYAFEEITVGDPNNDDYDIEAELFPESSVDFYGQLVAWRRLDVIVTDEEIDQPVEDAKVTIEISDGNGAIYTLNGPLFSENSTYTDHGESYETTTDVNGGIGSYVYIGTRKPESKSVKATVTVYGEKDSVLDQPLGSTTVNLTLNFLAPADAVKQEVTLFQYTMYADTYNNIVEIESQVPETGVAITVGDTGVLGDDDIIRYGNTSWSTKNPAILAPAVVLADYNGIYANKIARDSDIFISGDAGLLTLEVTNGLIRIDHPIPGEKVRHELDHTVVMEESKTFVADPEADTDRAYSGVPYAEVYLADPDNAAGGVVWKGTADVKGQIIIPIRNINSKPGDKSVVGPASEEDAPKKYDIFLSSPNFKYNRDPNDWVWEYGFLDVDWLRGNDDFTDNDVMKIPYIPTDRAYTLEKTVTHKVTVKAWIWLKPNEKVPKQGDEATG